MSERGFRVICPGCGDTVSHSCHSALKSAVVALLSWIPEGGLATEELEKAFDAAGREQGWISEDEKPGDAFKHPFFGSQHWSYPLFGFKDTARSFHALIHEVVRAAGLDPNDIENDIFRKRNARQRMEEERAAAVKKKRDERDEVAAYLKSDAPLEERIAKLDEILRKRAGVPGADGSLVPYSTDEDAGYRYLIKFINKFYGGGIGPEMNWARVQKLESEAAAALEEKQRF